jgi:hypothetical protein
MSTRTIGRLSAGAVVAIALAAAPQAQGLLPTITVPAWVGRVVMSGSTADTLVLNNTVMQTDAASTSEELPGLGHKFELLGVMERDTDPENSTGNSGGSGGGVGGNETISATMTPTTVALAFRNLPPGPKINAFTNQLGFKHYFVAPRDCGGGSPRLTLLVDSDGDNNFNFAVHGHVNPPYTGCIKDDWVYHDLSDQLPRWEVTPGGAVPMVPSFPFVNWDTLRLAVTAAFPNHKILAGFLVDDSCSFMSTTCGKAYYDLVTIENRTLEIWQDTVKK